MVDLVQSQARIETKGQDCTGASMEYTVVMANVSKIETNSRCLFCRTTLPSKKNILVAYLWLRVGVFLPSTSPIAT